LQNAFDEKGLLQQGIEDIRFFKIVFIDLLVVTIDALDVDTIFCRYLITILLF